jgi:hypothetical protein
MTQTLSPNTLALVDRLSLALAGTHGRQVSAGALGMLLAVEVCDWKSDCLATIQPTAWGSDCAPLIVGVQSFGADLA